MTTEYIAGKTIRASELFDGRLEKFGIRERILPEVAEELKRLDPDVTYERKRCLTDGISNLGVFVKDDGSIGRLVDYNIVRARNKNLKAIGEEFGTNMIPEYEPEFWGFCTEDGFLDWQIALGEIEIDEIMRFLRGEPHDISRGTVGLVMADLVKELVTKYPALLLSENADQLRDTIRELNQRPNGVTLRLSDDDLTALARFA
jgi:hypothetical protein